MGRESVFGFWNTVFERGERRVKEGFGGDYIEGVLFCVKGLALIIIEYKVLLIN